MGTLPSTPKSYLVSYTPGLLGFVPIFPVPDSPREGARQRSTYACTVGGRYTRKQPPQHSRGTANCRLVVVARCDHAPGPHRKRTALVSKPPLVATILGTDSAAPSCPSGVPP
eukprot:8459602-Pyramimonas_sp.AAC.1